MCSSVPVLCALVATLAGGCYASHERRAGAPDAGPTVTRDAGPTVTADAPPPPPSCAPIARTIEVPRAGCVAEVIANTTGNACGGSGTAASIVRVRRPAPGSDWYFLIRSRDPAATRIAAGLVGDGCTCTFAASAMGGDLTRSGVGGDISDPSTTELELVLDGDGRAIWLRVCDGAPG